MCLGGELFKGDQIICQEMLQACGDDDTLKKLERLHPAGNPILNRESWPDDDEVRAFWASDEGRAKIDKFLSVDSIRQWFRRRPALGAPDIDGWQGREHIAFMLKTPGGFHPPTTEHLLVGRRLYLKRVAAPPPAYSL